MWIAGIQPCEHNYLMISYRDSISRKMEFGLDQGHIWTLLLKEEDISRGLSNTRSASLPFLYFNE